jgi:hypothetical protein
LTNESLYSDGQQFYRYHQNEQPPSFRGTGKKQKQKKTKKTKKNKKKRKKRPPPHMNDIVNPDR